VCILGDFVQKLAVVLVEGRLVPCIMDPAWVEVHGFGMGPDPSGQQWVIYSATCRVHLEGKEQISFRRKKEGSTSEQKARKREAHTHMRGDGKVRLDLGLVYCLFAIFIVFIFSGFSYSGVGRMGWMG
jgi:hypothetical protein